MGPGSGRVGWGGVGVGWGVGSILKGRSGQLCIVLYQQHPAFTGIKDLGGALEEQMKTLSIVIILPPNSRFSGRVVHSFTHSLFIESHLCYIRFPL